MTVRNSTRIGAVVLSAGICWYLTATGLPAANGATWLSGFPSQWFAATSDTASRSGATHTFNWDQLSHIKLTDQDGQPFKPGKSQADATLLNFMFTGCTTECPLQTAQLKIIHEKLDAQLPEQKVQFLSVTITPYTDGINTLKAFANRFDVDHSNWRFLRASPTDTAELINRFAVTSSTVSDTQPDHRNALYLLNSEGDLVQQYAADPINVDRVSREVAQLMMLE